MYYAKSYHTAFGAMMVVTKDNKITAFYPSDKLNIQDYIIEETPIMQEAIRQLQQYAEGARQQFDLPLAFEGTAFQQRVWQELCEIPYGKTVSYKDIAVAIGKPNAARAIGNANNKNKIIIIVPCHRVIGANKKLVGYGLGLPFKERLLQLEGAIVC